MSLEILRRGFESLAEVLDVLSPPKVLSQLALRHRAEAPDSIVGVRLVNLCATSSAASETESGSIVVSHDQY